MKQVLVLMTTYNGEEYLDKQISSIVNQKEVSTHLLIRDDGSTDATKAIIRSRIEFGERITLLEANKDEEHGAMVNFYKLLLHAQKEYVNKYDFFALSDQDDIWVSDKLIRMSENLINNNKPELVYANYCVIDTEDNLVVEDVSAEIGLDYKNPLTLMYNNSFAWGHSIIFNPKLLETICIDDDVIMSEFSHDAYFAKYAVICDGIKYDPRVFVKYRRHGNNVSSIWYKFSLSFLSKGVNLVREGKVYANLVNANLLLFEKNNNEYIDTKIIDEYMSGLKLRGIQTFSYFKNNNIYRKQKSRDFNMKLTYSLGIYKNWLGNIKKIEIKK